MSGRRNADADWDSWPVEEYLAENYRVLHPGDAAVIAHHSAFYRELEPGVLRRTVEIGTGPNLYPLMLAAAASRRIDALDTSAANLTYLKHQLRHGPDVSWYEFYAECRRFNPRLPASLADALSAVRPRHGDAMSVTPGRYDLASMHFVAESVTADRTEFHELCDAFVHAVRPGGYLVAAFMANMPTYRLGDGSTWPAYPVDAGAVRAAFTAETEILRLAEIARDDTLPAYGDTGMIVLHARRR